MSDDPFCLTSPEVRSRIPRPAPTQPGDRDPYRVPGPAVVSFSGGRTSGYLLRRVLDAYNGRLPHDVHVVFANTGEEDVRTLDFVHRCATEWGVRIVWVEYHDECDGRWREVDYATASRSGEPFARLLDRKGALPNGRMRFCTQELKLRPMRGFMRSMGYGDDWTNIVGLRWDEPGRVSTLRARDSAWDVVCPLYDARVSKADVMAWWKAQPFDLTTPSYAGNCVGCFLKGRTLRDRAAREAPEVWERWAHHERVAGARFIHSEPEGYAGQLRRVVALPVLPFDDSDDAFDGTLPCDCTQRRAPPLRTCTCGAARGQGHALMCSRVWGDQPGIYYAPAPGTDDAARVLHHDHEAL